ncbi:MAG TPA: hypothetical protein PLS10_09835 [Chitinophagales bacterium]|nr:hypothetical protein [Chitinophagales bacterium]
MRKFYILVLLSFTFITVVSGKIVPEDKQEKLSENGIALIDNTKSYTDHQYYLLSSFDFNSYRNYESKRIVQIENGPLIELSSLTEMQNLNKPISSELLEKKKEEKITPTLKKIITLINIGFLQPPVLNTETGY